MPVLHLIAGLAGAGKSTLRQVLVAPRHPRLPVVSVDALEGSQGSQQQIAVPHSSPGGDAAPWPAHLAAGTSFIAETCLAQPTELASIARAQERGFQVVVYALAHDEPALLKSRRAPGVRRREDPVKSHQAKVDQKRASLCLERLGTAVFLADLAFLFDAGDASDGGPRLVACVSAGRMQLHTLVRPRWVDRILGFAER